MANKQINARVALKHDVEANWITAGENDFCPLAGEVIIFDPDDSCAMIRYKIGRWANSAKTELVNINDLPFEANLMYVEQQLTDEQKQVARENIDAVSQSELTTVENQASQAVSNLSSQLYDPAYETETGMSIRYIAGQVIDNEAVSLNNSTRKDDFDFIYRNGTWNISPVGNYYGTRSNYDLTIEVNGMNCIPLSWSLKGVEIDSEQNLFYQEVYIYSHATAPIGVTEWENDIIRIERFSNKRGSWSSWHRPLYWGNNTDIQNINGNKQINGVPSFYYDSNKIGLQPAITDVSIPTSSYSGYSIPQRDENGDLHVLETPLTDTSATCKKYVDDQLDGKVSKSGDTMTGALNVTMNMKVIGDSWNNIGFISTEGKRRGEMMLDASNCIHFNNTETGATYSDRYKLPKVTTGKTADTWYNILTSKNAVTVAQGGTGATTAANAIKNLGVPSVISNPNLLINSDFRVNQRGQTSYNNTNAASGKYTLDRWIHYASGAYTMTPVNGGGVTIVNSGSTNVDFAQIIENGIALLDGKTVTASASVDGTIYSVTATLSSAISKSVILKNSSSTNIGALYIQRTSAVCKVWFRVYAGKTLNLDYVKLEMGSYATPYSPRPYAEELAICQQYYRRIYSDQGITILPCSGHLNTYSAGAKSLTAIVTFPYTFIKTPTFKSSLSEQFYWHNGFSGSPTKAVLNYSETNNASIYGITYTFTYSAGLAVGAAYAPITLGLKAGGYIEFDAELY